MVKRKYPSELNTRQIRVYLGQYALLRDLSNRLNVTMAEALQFALENQEEQTRVSPSQIPMPISLVVPRSAIAVNGNRSIAFKIKPKGGVIHE